MLSSVEQAFVGRDEKQALLKTPAWEANTGPDCPIFSTKLFLRPFNSIVPLFSSDNVIKCAFICVLILAGRHLRVIFR